MIIKWLEDGVWHEADWSGSPRTQEGRWIKERTGWSTVKFLTALEDLDPDAVIGLVILLAAREGRKLKWDDVDIDPINEFELIPTEDEKQRAEEAMRNEAAAKEAASKGVGSPIPPARDLPVSVSNPTGQRASGHLGAVALSPRSEHTLTNSGSGSVSTTLT